MLRTSRTQRASLATLALLAVPALLLTASSVAAQTPQTTSVGLEGYCPVCILDGKKWIRGTAEHEAMFDGVTYRFPEAGAKQKFLMTPEKYAPALGGDCIVCYAKMGKRVPGSIRHAAFYSGRLYLFPSDKEKQMFLGSPAMFADSDLALNGECSVCLAHANKHVPGKPEFTAVHDGLRYLFPSDNERQVFLKNPTKYAAQTAMTMRAGLPANLQLVMTNKPVMKEAANAITVSGRSGCAACEHGVTPIYSPQELGLAVNTSDGHVYVIEYAHTKYPTAYKARYGGQSLSVTGEVVKTKGKVTWIKPTSLTVN